MSIKVEHVRESYDKYLLNTDYFSSADLKAFLKSPKLFYSNKIHVDNKHYALLQAANMLLNDSKGFFDTYALAPNVKLNTNAGKDAQQKFLSELNGRTPLREVDYQLIVETAASISSIHDLEHDLPQCQMELSCYFTDPKTGIKLKMRPSAYDTKKKFIYDTKFTSRYPSKTEFKTETEINDFALSAAIAEEFLGVENYFCLYIKHSIPFHLACYMFTVESTKEAKERLAMALTLLSWSIENKFWCDISEFALLKTYYEMNRMDLAYNAVTSPFILVEHI